MNSRYFATPPSVSPRNEGRNSILMTCHYLDLGSASHWLKQLSHAARLIRSNTQIWIVTRHQYGISVLVSQTSLRGETSDGVAKCRLFCQAVRNPNTWYLFTFAVPPEILDRHLRYIMHGQGIEGYAMAHAAVRRNTISSLTVERGYNLILLCTVVGKPTPHITWTKNRVLIRNDTRHLLLPSGVLLVRQVDIKGSGHYKCVATNAVGKDQGSVRLTVKNLAVG